MFITGNMCCYKDNNPWQVEVTLNLKMCITSVCSDLSERFLHVFAEQDQQKIQEKSATVSSLHFLYFIKNCKKILINYLNIISERFLICICTNRT